MKIIILLSTVILATSCEVMQTVGISVVEGLSTCLVNTIADDYNLDDFITCLKNQAINSTSILIDEAAGELVKFTKGELDKIRSVIMPEPSSLQYLDKKRLVDLLAERIIYLLARSP